MQVLVTRDKTQLSGVIAISIDETVFVGRIKDDGELEEIGCITSHRNEGVIRALDVFSVFPAPNHGLQVMVVFGGDSKCIHVYEVVFPVSGSENITTSLRVGIPTIRHCITFGPYSKKIITITAGLVEIESSESNRWLKSRLPIIFSDKCGEVFEIFIEWSTEEYDPLENKVLSPVLRCSDSGLPYQRLLLQHFTMLSLHILIYPKHNSSQNANLLTCDRSALTRLSYYPCTNIIREFLWGHQPSSQSTTTAACLYRQANEESILVSGHADGSINFWSLSVSQEGGNMLFASYSPTVETGAVLDIAFSLLNVDSGVVLNVCILYERLARLGVLSVSLKAIENLIEKNLRTQNDLLCNLNLFESDQSQMHFIDLEAHALGFLNDPKESSFPIIFLRTGKYLRFKKGISDIIFSSSSVQHSTELYASSISQLVEIAISEDNESNLIKDEKGEIVNLFPSLRLYDRWCTPRDCLKHQKLEKS